MAVVETERHGQILVVRMNRPRAPERTQSRNAHPPCRGVDRVPPQQ